MHPTESYVLSTRYNFMKPIKMEVRLITRFTSHTDNGDKAKIQWNVVFPQQREIVLRAQASSR
jgi:hypothetical protein